ncbi:MAG: hypothetical protein ACI865_001446 [Flavobacteriaceae bacterium]|jgi:hypothetical protein
MTVRQISNVNEATLILRHFIDLSARLLPFLDELQRKRRPTRGELNDREKIIGVYESYSFDTCTSISLLNSNILELIQESFEDITKCRNSRDYNKAQRKLVTFMLEYKRLNDNWVYATAN